MRHTLSSAILPRVLGDVPFSALTERMTGFDASTTIAGMISDIKSRDGWKTVESRVLRDFVELRDRGALGRPLFCDERVPWLDTWNEFLQEGSFDDLEGTADGGLIAAPAMVMVASALVRVCNPRKYGRGAIEDRHVETSIDYDSITRRIEVAEKDLRERVREGTSNAFFGGHVEARPAGGLARISLENFQPAIHLQDDGRKVWHRTALRFCDFEEAMAP